MTPKELAALAGEVNALTPPDRLRLAADLLQLGRGQTALIIIRRIADELQLAIILAEGPR